MIFRIINKLGRITPTYINRHIVNYPFKYRFSGKIYDQFRKNIIPKNSNELEIELYVLEHFRRVFQYAKKFEMYQKKYKAAGVFDLEINSLDDIAKLPILTKAEVRKHVHEFKGHSYRRTGGTSGNPLLVQMDKEFGAREWAHYHTIWSQAQYKPTIGKFKFHRPHLTNDFIVFDFQHNEYIVNSYNRPNDYIDRFFKTLATRNIQYFHGHPSAMTDFLKDIEAHVTPEQKALITSKIKCCFFASEMPLPHLVKYIREVWKLNTISMYGHTEGCVLAATQINGLDYKVYHTYGFVEVVDNKLIGTSYHNYDMPLIRYDTDDIVAAERFENGIVNTFRVTEGRILDYIVDKNDYRICYAAMFCDKHHEVFDHIDYLQLHQDEKGKATLVISRKKEGKVNAPGMMHLDDFEVDFDFMYLKEPVRTEAGKIPLRLKELPLNKKSSK